jgi:hypothetical protein
MEIKSTEETLFDMCRRLDSGQRIVYTRFGDNDIIMMSGTDLKGNPLGDRTFGGNKTSYSPELSMKLQNTFSQDFMIGLSGDYPVEPGMRDGLFMPFAYKQELVDKVMNLTPRSEFYSPILFQYLMCFNFEAFQMFLDKHIKGKKVLYIGSTKKAYVETILGTKVDVIQTPEKGAFSQYDEIANKCDKVAHTYDIIIPSCGQTSRALTFFLSGVNEYAHIIDMGSIFDIFNSEATRTWIRLMGNTIRSRYGVASNPQWVKSEIQLDNDKKTKYDYLTQSIQMEEKIGQETTHKLDILIPTLYERREGYKQLYRELMAQIDRLHLGNAIKIKTKFTGGDVPIGGLRNDLLINSTAEYVAHFDDDDWPTPYYIESIWKALENDVDCITFKVSVNHVETGNMTAIDYDLNYKEYQNFVHDGVRTLQRPPGHLCVMRKDIALKFPFMVIWGDGGNRKEREDNASDVYQLKEVLDSVLLKTQAKIDKFLYIYNYTQR